RRPSFIPRNAPGRSQGTLHRNATPGHDWPGGAGPVRPFHSGADHLSPRRTHHRIDCRRERGCVVRHGPGSPAAVLRLILFPREIDMPKYGVIFDMDGVLIDSYEAHLESWRQLARELDRDITDEQFAATFGRTSRDIIRLLFGAN